jgi:hypothetical protein
MALERRGIPTATFITHAFASYAQGLTRMQKMSALPLVVIAHPVAARPVAELQEKVRSAYGGVRAALTRADAA